MDQRTILEDDKRAVKMLHPREEWNIIAATVARLYVALPDPNSWTYANIMGALIFARNEAKNTFYFRIVDLLSGRGLLWDQELFEGFQYNLDLSFFHSFPADNYVAGFSFANEHEANTFYKRVTTRGERNKQKIRTIPIPGPATVAAAPPAAGRASSSLFDSLSRSKTKKERPKLDKSMIGQPKNFQHLGHIGWDPQKGFSAENIPPDWRSLLGRAGVSEDALKDEATAKFVVDFVQSHGGIEAAKRGAIKPGPAPAAAVARPGRPGASNTPPARATTESPSLGTEKAGKRPPPPPPPRQRGAGPGASPQAQASAPPPPPPPRALPLPAAAAAAAAAESPRTSARAPPVPSAPPPPPPPPTGGAPPPPPPPPPPPAAAPPLPAQPVRSPAVPRPASTPAAPPGGGGRSDFLASIKNAGGISSLKPAAAREQPDPLPVDDGAGGGNDLASALAAALAARSKVIADESDEEEEDDWDD